MVDIDASLVNIVRNYWYSEILPQKYCILISGVLQYQQKGGMDMKEELRNGVRLIRYRALSAYDNFFEADGIAVTTDNLHRSSLDETVHQHDYYELEYIAAGVGIQWINGCTYVVKKGDVIFFRLQDSHQYDSLRGMDVVNCCFRPEVLRDQTVSIEQNPLGGTVIHLSEEEQTDFETILTMLQKECLQKKPHCQDAAKYYLNLLLIFLKRIGYLNEQEVRRWGDLFRYLSDRYQTVTLEDAATYMHVTKSYFCRIFRQKTGMTFLSYMTDLRIGAAKELLLTTDLSVSEIWASVGFTQAKRFYEQFHRCAGCPPGEYREMNK